MNVSHRNSVIGKVLGIILALAAVKVAFAAADLTDGLEFIGNPQLERWPNNEMARACLDLQFYQGRLFNGGGEVESNPGAPWISSIDPFDNSTRFEFAPGTEAIANYRIASWGDLLTSAQDPHEGDLNLGHVFTRTPGGTWSIFKSVGGSLASSSGKTVANNTHCWDMEEFDGRVFVAGYNLMSSTDKCKTFSACTDLTSAYVSIVYAASKSKTLSYSHLRRQIQLLRFGDTALFAVPNTLLQPNVMNDTRTCKQEVFRYDLSTHKFAEISQRASDIYPELSSSDYQLVGRNLTYFSTDTYARTFARIWHTTPFKDRVLYVGCYDTPPYSSVVSPWEDKISLTSYPLPLMGCSAAVVDNQIKATRISFGNDKTNYPWDFAVVGDTVYALTSRYVADGQKNHHIVWKSTDGVNFTEVFSFDFHQNFISLEYRDGWFYLGVGYKAATKGYTYDKTADESGSIYRVRCPQEPIQVVPSVDTLELAEGSSAVVSFRLSAQPASNVTLRVGATLANSRFTTDKTALTFTTADWATPQEVTVSVAGNGTLDANRSGAVVCGATGFDVARGEFYSPELTSGTIGSVFTDAELVEPANGEIRTADDFYCAMAYPDGDYRLMADIDLEGSLFTTIDEFTGTLNGNGFTLSGLGDGPIAKRFSGVVENLTLDGDGAEVKGCSRGLFFDEANGGAFTNCTVKGYALKAETSDSCLGLFVGVATGPISFCRCSTDANCLLDQANQHDTSLGGFVAKVALPPEGGVRIVFESCTNNAAISATDNYRAGSGAGGFVGVVNGTLPLTPTNEVLFVRCANEGQITSAGRNNSIGGLVGRFNVTYNKNASIDTKFVLCANEGDISIPENGTQSGSAGGFTGNVGSSNNIIFSRCTSTGTIAAPAVITTGPFAAVGETVKDDSIAADYPETPPDDPPVEPDDPPVEPDDPPVEPDDPPVEPDDPPVEPDDPPVEPDDPPVEPDDPPVEPAKPTELVTNDWFDVEFEDTGYKAGSDWTKISTDKSGGTWSGDDGEATTLDGTTFVVTLTDTFEGELRYTPGKASEANADVVVEGRVAVSAAPREIRPEGAPFAMTFESKPSGNLTPVAYIGGAWHSFGSTGFAVDTWVDWKVEVDQTSTNAPRIQVTVAQKGGAVEASGWIAGGFAAKRVSALSYIGVGSFGDFKARYLTAKGGGVIELVPPEFAADGSALGFKSGIDDARMFALKITNPVKGAYYTVLTSTTLEGPFLPEGDSVLFDKDSGMLTLEVSADTPQKFAKILVSLEPYE